MSAKPPLILFRAGVSMLVKSVPNLSALTPPKPSTWVTRRKSSYQALILTLTRRRILLASSHPIQSLRLLEYIRMESKDDNLESGGANWRGLARVASWTGGCARTLEVCNWVDKNYICRRSPGSGPKCPVEDFGTDFVRKRSGGERMGWRLIEEGRGVLNLMLA